MKWLNDPSRLAELEKLYPESVINGCWTGGGFSKDGRKFSVCKNCKCHWDCTDQDVRRKWMCDKCWFSESPTPDIREAKELAEIGAWLQENAMRRNLSQQAEARR